MSAYLRLDVDPGATVYNTIPLKQAFGIVERSDRTVHATVRLDPARFVHPIEVAWSGRRGDVMTGNVSFRNHDLVMSAAAFARLEGARIGPHLDVPVHCVKTTEWGIRRLGVPVPHRWIAWAEDWETTESLDLFYLPRMGGACFVSEQLGAALLAAPRLKGFRLLRDDGTEVAPPRSRRR